MTIYTNPIFEKVAHHADTSPQKIALREQGGRHLSYRDLVDQSRWIAENLLQHGFQPGERALFLVRPGINATLLLFGIILAGGVVVIADPGMGPDVFTSRVNLVKPTWVFAESVLLAVDSLPLLRRRLNLPSLTSLSAAKFVSVGFVLAGIRHDLTFKQLLQPLTGSAEQRADPSAEVLIIFTSGTTAAPKAVVHSIGSINAALTIITENLMPTADDKFYGDTLHIVVPALTAGATAIFPPDHFSARQTLADYRRYQVTRTMGVPAEFEQMVRYCKIKNVTLPPTLKTIMLGSAPVYTPFLKRLAPICDPATEIIAIYGMTEIAPLCAVRATEKLAYQGTGDLVGQPLNEITIRVASDGELIVGGPNLFSRYINAPDVTEHTTGDMGCLDEQGRVVLLGRKKDMIIRGDVNIYPALYEPTILEISGVRACAMIGLYNTALHDESVVLVVEKEGIEDDETFRQRVEWEIRSGNHRIDRSALPDRVVIMPIWVSGRSQKPDKNRLRQQLSEKLSAS